MDIERMCANARERRCSRRASTPVSHRVPPCDKLLERDVLVFILVESRENVVREKMVLHGPDFVCELLRDFRVSEAHLFALLYPNALSQLHEPLVFEGLKQHLRRPRARNASANKGIGR